MKKHKHQCTRTKPLHTPCRCRCGAERVTRNAYGVEMPRTGGRWKTPETVAALVKAVQ